VSGASNAKVKGMQFYIGGHYTEFRNIGPA
jgi:hypothetical protein